MDREQEFLDTMQSCGPSIQRFARAFTRSPSDTEDLTQEIALAIWRALPTLRKKVV